MDGTLPVVEVKRLMKALAQPENRLLAEQLLEEGYQAELQTYTFNSVQESKILGHIFWRGRFRKLLKPAGAAAAIMAVCIGSYLGLRAPKPIQVTKVVIPHDIKPGHNQATLTLADGRKVVLSKGLSGNIARQLGANINADHKEITYRPFSGQASAVAYNTLTTARGEQSPYPLVLADGTKVWLNAESTITFPTSFKNQTERIVKLSGEAYFEVNHDAAHPFKVQTSKQTIEDIGTNFDVNAYDNEPRSRTTLVEGSVKVNGTLLKPGEQLDGNQVKSVNTSLYTAWKDNLFQFRNEDIQYVMRELARWYNIDISYQGRVTPERFNCRISKNRNISTVLQLLEKTQGVHFKIEGRRVTVIE